MPEKITLKEENGWEMFQNVYFSQLKNLEEVNKFLDT